MSRDDDRQQELMHQIIESVIPDDDTLLGWVVLYETESPDGTQSAGQFDGPEVTTWQWAQR